MMKIIFIEKIYILVYIFITMKTNCLVIPSSKCRLNYVVSKFLHNSVNREMFESKKISKPLLVQGDFFT